MEQPINTPVAYGLQSLTKQKVALNPLAEHPQASAHTAPATTCLRGTPQAFCAEVFGCLRHLYADWDLCF